jgi:hypothetical protein
VDSESDSDTDLVVAMEASSMRRMRSTCLKWRGFLAGGAANLDRNREAGHVQLYNDYFHPKMVVYQNYFWHHFRISRKLFGRIIEGVRLHDSFQMQVGYRLPCLLFLSKMFSGYTMLAHGVARDLANEYMRMHKSTCIKSMCNFC